MVPEGTRPEEERGEKNEGKRMAGKGPESALKKLRVWYPYDLGTLFSGPAK